MDFSQARILRKLDYYRKSIVNIYQVSPTRTCYLFVTYYGICDNMLFVGDQCSLISWVALKNEFVTKI